MIHHPIGYGRLLGALLPLMTWIPLSGFPPLYGSILGQSGAAIAQSATTEQGISESQTQLGLAVFQQLGQTQGNENLLVSPLSLSMALALLYGGAEGLTQQEMSRVLGYADDSQEAVDGSYEALLQSLGELSGDVELAIANSIWSRRDSPLNGEFVRSRQHSYQAEIQQVDFGDTPQALAAIQDWVSQQTQGRIAEILSHRDVDENTVAVVLNALYFSGAWTSPFPPEDTEIQPFTRRDQSQVYVPMMRQHLPVARGYQNGLFQAVELPYGEDERLGMYVFIPRDGVSLDDFYEQLTMENWRDWLRRFEWNEAGAIVHLPQFELMAEVNLSESLEALGLGEIFTPGANFSALTDEDFWVTVMRQQLYLEVTEAGTEAAAVTGIGGTRSAAFSIVGDRPFVFAIRDNDTGLLLFLGSVVDPSL